MHVLVCLYVILVPFRAQYGQHKILPSRLGRFAPREKVMVHLNKNFIKYTFIR